VFYAISSLFKLPYFHRIWIFQELVLGMNVIMVYGGRIIPLYYLLSVYQWFRAVREINTLEERPDFVNDSVWTNLLRLDFTLIGSILYARRLALVREAHPGKIITASFLLSTSEASYQASSPKDYVYDFSGVTGICINPDYGESKAVAGVYCDFVKDWFSHCDEYAVAGCKPDPCILWFLFASGTGYNCREILDLPSSAPNFLGKATAKDLERNRIMFNNDYCADAGFFIQDGGHPRLEQSGLHCSMAAVDNLRHVGPPIDTDMRGLRRLLEWVIECIARSRINKPQRCHTFLAVLQVILCKVAKQTTSRSSRNTMRMLSMFWMVHSSSRIPDAMPLGTITASAIPQFLSKLRLEQMNQDGFPTTITLQAVEQDLRDVDRSIPMHECFSLLRFSEGFRICQTSDGYIGIFPPKAAVGDIVAVVEDCQTPILLRKTAAYYNHVGTCFVAGLMDGEAAGLVHFGEKMVEDITIT
jgi:hypothetical protein